MNKNKRMTLRNAIQILMEHAGQNCRGAGCGIRNIPNPERRKEVREAMKRVWPMVYGYEATETDIINKS